MGKRSAFDMKAWELQDVSSDGFRKFLERSHKFLVGNGHWDVCWEFGNSLIEKRIFKLPFDEVIFEYNDPNFDARRLVLACFDANGFINVIPFIRYGDREWSGGPEFILRLDQDHQPAPMWWAEPNYGTTSDPLFRDNHTLNSDIVTATVAMLSMKETLYEDVEAPERLKKHRARRRELPLFAYRVAELNPTSTRHDPLGGTHSSPALHWRRGHFRHLSASNKIVSVVPHLVGTLERGYIRKDYDGRKLNTLTQRKLPR